MGYKPAIRVSEDFFNRVFAPAIIQHCWIISCRHWGVFFCIDSAYVPFRVIYPLGYPAILRPVPREVMERFIKVLEHQRRFPQYYLRIIWRGGMSKSFAIRTLTEAYERRIVEYRKHGGIGEYVIYKQSLEPGDIPGAARSDVRFFVRFIEKVKYGGEVVLEDYFPESAEAHECLWRWEREMPEGHGAVYRSVAYTCPKPKWSIADTQQNVKEGSQCLDF